MHALIAALWEVTVGSLLAGALLLLCVGGVLFYHVCLEIFGGAFEPPLLPESDDPLVTNP